MYIEEDFLEHEEIFVIKRDKSDVEEKNRQVKSKPKFVHTDVKGIHFCGQ